MPEQYVYAAPPMQQVVYVNEAGQQVDEAGNLVQVEGQVMEGQVMYAAPEAQQILYVDEHGQPVEAPEGAVFEQPVLYAPPPVAAPARINVSPEIFAKLAAGGTLTPEEMAQLSGEAAPVEPVMPVPGSPAPAAPAAPAAAANTSAKASKKKEKGSKKALKASKKKKEKGCC